MLYSPPVQIRLFLAAILSATLLACSPEKPYSPELAARLPDKVDFNFHIRPILSDRCFACHGPDEAARKANLRLDDVKAAGAGNLCTTGSGATVFYLPILSPRLGSPRKPAPADPGIK